MLLYQEGGGGGPLDNKHRWVTYSQNSASDLTKKQFSFLAPKDNNKKSEKNDYVFYFYTKNYEVISI